MRRITTNARESKKKKQQDVSDTGLTDFGSVPNGSQWYSMVSNGTQRYRMVLNGIEWYSMVANGIERYRLVPAVWGRWAKDRDLGLGTWDQGTAEAQPLPACQRPAYLPEVGRQAGGARARQEVCDNANGHLGNIGKMGKDADKQTKVIGRSNPQAIAAQGLGDFGTFAKLCESLRIVANRCESLRIVANRCESLRIVANRCESLRIVANLPARATTPGQAGGSLRLGPGNTGWHASATRLPTGGGQAEAWHQPRQATVCKPATRNQWPGAGASGKVLGFCCQLLNC